MGGAIRDVLLGYQPKDFDVVTNATPNEIKRLFRNSRLIGRRFKLAHVFYGRDYVEVATYRRSHDEPHDEDEGVIGKDGLILRDNIYGTLEQDVYRRDFTVNGLYYRLSDFALIDYVGAIDDLSNRVIRSIGDPMIRFREDPVRMLRAIRFAVKLDFSLDSTVTHAISQLKDEIPKIPPARLFDESLKLFQTGKGEQAYRLLQTHGLFHVLFPVCLSANHKPEKGADALLIEALKSTDQRLAQNKTVTPAFVFAAVLWVPMGRERLRYRSQGLSNQESLIKASKRVMNEAVRVVGVHRRFLTTVQEIWMMQARFEKRNGKAPFRLLEQPRFRAAYDFLALRAQVGEVSQELVDWWTKFQVLNQDERVQYIQAITPSKRPRKRKSKE